MKIAEERNKIVNTLKQVSQIPKEEKAAMIMENIIKKAEQGNNPFSALQILLKLPHLIKPKNESGKLAIEYLKRCNKKVNPLLLSNLGNAEKKISFIKPTT